MRKIAMKTLIGSLIVIISAVTTEHANADVGMGIRVSTFGFTGDVDFTATPWATIRVGYHGLNYSREYNETSVLYSGKVTINAASAIADWNVFRGGFHLSLGAVSNGPKIDVIGMPTNGTYTINGTTYQASDVGSLSGRVNVGKSMASYVGFGWGNPASEKSRVTFLLDAGAIHTGTISATLNVTCNPALPIQTCDQLTSDAMAEKTKLEDKASKYRWYPVISLGIGIRF